MDTNKENGKSSDNGQGAPPKAHDVFSDRPPYEFYQYGITEAKNSVNELFWENRLKESLGRNSRLPLEKTLTALLDSIADWSGTEEYADDITIIALERE